MTIPDDGRDQALIFSSAERGYLIDAMMVFMKQVEKTWSFGQYRELMILMEHLRRPGHHHQGFLGKQVTVTLNRESPGIPAEGFFPEEPAQEDVIISGQLLGVGDCGTFEILEDDGFIHYCWPMLEIRERNET